MMPCCPYKRCKRVSDRKLGVIDTGEKYLAKSDRTWEETAYVCEKHYLKVLNKLGFANPKDSK